ncbi:hypothetical protein F5X97DRAFT_141182 [Nemania serpens]|nr:hypothetical protein F5X97DRAFT_141182 [Nemania serpens]
MNESITQPAIVVNRGQEATEIISLAAMGAERLALVGTEGGLVVLFDTSTAKLQSTLYSHGRHLMVTHVSWSAGGYIATADASSIIQIWAVSQDADSTMRASQKVMEVENPSSIRRIALSPSGSKLLVCGASSDSIHWISNADLESAPTTSTVEDSVGMSRTWAWLPQPFAGFDLAMVSDSTLQLYQINDRTRDVSLKVKATLTFEGSRLLSSAHKLTLTKTSKFIAVDLETTRGAAASKLLVYCLEHIPYEVEGASDHFPCTLQPLLCLHNKMIRMFIGWHDHALVFLDTDLWICSIDMASIKNGETRNYTRRRHFFIPYELIGSNNGVAPILASETSIVFPREGSLSIIEDALSSVFMSDEIVG